MTIRELLAEESPTLRRRLASLFSGLPDETPASPLSCAAGEVVVRQDAPCRCVYVLVEGRDVYKRQVIPIDVRVICATNRNLNEICLLYTSRCV